MQLWRKFIWHKVIWRKFSTAQALNIGLLTLLLASCTEPPALKHQVYIWQRQWTEQHPAVLAQSKTDFNALRVLAMQIDLPDGTYLWQQSRVDLTALQQDARPVIVVVRIDGTITELQHLSIAWTLKPLLKRWQDAGVKVAGVEIDYDSPRSQLPLYQVWLKQLKTNLPNDLPLRITALPDWLLAGEFPDLLSAVDGITLQLHSILSPEQGLFDVDVAKAWVRQLLVWEPTSFDIALPAYHSALIAAPTSKSGYVVESEVPIKSQGERREMYVDPASVAEFLDWLQQTQPEGLANVVWFRLPMPHDKRAWPLPTLQAVIRQLPLAANIELSITGQAPLFELVAKNTGNTPGAMPEIIDLLGTNCSGMDPLADYVLQQTGDEISLKRSKNLGLAAGQQLKLGWFRCQTLQLD